MSNSKNDPQVAQTVAEVAKKDSKKKAEIFMAPHSGLYLRFESGTGHQRVCPPFKLLGKVVDPDGGNPAYLIEFDTLLLQRKRVELPLAILNSADKVFRLLTEAGFESPRDNFTRRLYAIGEYLKLHCPNETFLRVCKDGWLKTSTEKLVYVQGNKVFGGDKTQRKIFREDATETIKNGHSKNWIELNQSLGDEPMAVLVACASFASVLLYPFGLSSILLFLTGASSTGKTVLLKYASSIFDTPQSLLTWAGTDNGIEAAMLQRQHKPLVIDEVGQASSKQFSNLSYLLTNSAGKLRASSQGQARKASTTHSVAISAGELSPIDKLAMSREPIMQGQIARLISVRSTMQHGVWNDLGQHADGASKSHDLLRQIEATHGLAGQRFCQVVASDIEEYKILFEAVVEDLALEICTEAFEANSDGVPRRVLRNFALFMFAGLLAVEQRVVPWTDVQVRDAIRETYTRWLTDYLALQPKNETALLASVRLFIESQRGSKFKPLITWDADHEGTVAGFEHVFRDGEDCYLVYPTYFAAQLCGEQPETLVLEALKKAGYLRLGSRGVPTVQISMPNGGGAKRSFYAIRKSILLG